MDNENGSAGAAVAVASNNDEQKLSIVDATKTEELKKRNHLIDVDGVSNKSSATVTTTSITVNIKKTSVNANESIGEVVSTVAEAATAAVASAAEKIDADKKPKSSSPVDVEMEDLTADVEMSDATPVAPAESAAPITSSAEVICEAPATTTNSQNEQKIDDVEKNISNLFNGEENAVADEAPKNGISTSVKDAVANADCSSSSAVVASENGAKNANEPNEKVTPSDDVIKGSVSDSSDLVSILTDDHPQIAAKISSTSTSMVDAKEASAASNAKAIATNSSVENKLLTSIAKSVTSTPSSSSSTGQTVYNSTPIQKQFEISSENVSTISEAATDTEHGLGDKSMRQEIISSHSSTANKSSDISSGAVTGSDSDQTSSGNLTRFAKVIRKFNGIGGDETDDASSASAEPTSVASKRDAKKSEATTAVTPVESGVSSSSEDNVYEINIWYDDAELVYFGVEKQDKSNNSLTATEHALEKISSVGSVSSMTEPFSLPTRCATITSTNSTLSSTSSLSLALASSTLKKTKHVVKGTLALCKFMIDHFQTVRTSLIGSAAGDSAISKADATPLNTTGSGRGRGKANTVVTTPTSTTTSNKRKRSTAPAASSTVATPTAAGDAVNDADEPKSSKKAKKETPANDQRKSIASPSPASNYPEKAVLARWVDKKFYAGRVIEQKANNKYVVLFEDGAKKVLPEEHIVFGEENILPLENESIHALVKDDTYEPGIVQSVKNKGDAIYYTVLCESTTVTVTASEIYLEDDQAKVILSKKTPSSANQPEPGFSGGINTRKDRRQKRTEYRRQTQWFSESDVSDIVESDSKPTSPVMAIVAVDGVQPELQHTQKESELVKLCYLMEHYGNDFKTVNLDDILGPIVTDNIFRNKCFLLTCTIPIKTTNGSTSSSNDERQNNNNYVYDLCNKNMAFSAVPFFKDHLKQQIESAGGVVYNNFEDVPKKKYRTCCLLSPFPCITAKYVQCLAANITAVSHEWVVECCQRRTLVSKNEFLLPSGWSILENCYKKWSIGRQSDHRKSVTPFNKTTIILTSQQNDFVQFWSRVCKFAGAKIRIVKSVNDLTATTQGYILMDDEFPHEYQAEAEKYKIPVVSTVWVVQSLVLGKVCDPTAHHKLTQLYEDDYF